MNNKFLFSFGIIADLQYTDFPNSKSFRGVERFHRNAFQQIENFFKDYSLYNQENENLNTNLNDQYRMLFTFHLGDLIDINAKTSPKLDMHSIINHFEENYFGRVWNMTSNHDFYNMKRDDVLDFFGIGFHGDQLNTVDIPENWLIDESTRLLSKIDEDFDDILNLSSPRGESHDPFNVHVVNEKGSFLDWDKYESQLHNFDELWKKYFEKITSTDSLDQHIIWDDNQNKIFRFKKNHISNLPKTRKGWRNLNIHESIVREFEKKYISILNEIVNKNQQKNQQDMNQVQSLYRKAYYSFQVEGFRFLVMDTYDISILGWPEGHPHRNKALKVIEKYHPKDISTSINSSTHLNGDDRRWVAYNGAIAKQQLEWAVNEIKKAKSQKQRVIICSHIPFLPADEESTAYLWNYRECLDTFYSVGKGVIVAFLAGHAHRGGFQIDEHGAGHATVEGAIESFGDCFGEVHVYEDRLEIQGKGKVTSNTINFPPYPDK